MSYDKQLQSAQLQIINKLIFRQDFIHLRGPMILSPSTEFQLMTFKSSVQTMVQQSVHYLLIHESDLCTLGGRLHHFIIITTVTYEN